MSYSTIVALLLFASATASAANALTKQECQARVERTITDDVGNRWMSGKILPVDIARAGADGGAFCAHGGSCLPRKVDGETAVILLNCRVGKSLGNGDHLLVAKPQAKKP